MSLVGLGVDEAYTLAIARNLQLSYFDHPPLHLWIVHLFGGLLGYGRLARLPFVLIFAGSSWLLFDLTRRLFGPKAAVWAVLALNLSGFFTVVASSWVLPDGPLIFCLLAAACELARLFFRPEGAAPAAPGTSAWTWVRAGLWIGLAGLAKYQAVLFGLGVGGFLASTEGGRVWLKRSGPYLGALVATAVVSPVIIWNAQHEWVSFAFQGGRAEPSHGLRPAAALGALLGQAALLLPWVFAPLTLAGWRALRAGPGDARRWFCIALGLPGVVLFAVTPLWGQTALPHWSMAAWLFLLPLMGDLLARAAADRPWPRTWALASLSALLLLWTVLASDTATGWVGNVWPKTFVKGDPTLESVEWGALAKSPSALKLLAEPGAFIVSMKWNEAGRIVPALGGGAPVVVFSDDPRGFSDTRGSDRFVGRDALIVVKPEDLQDGLGRVGRCFAGVEPLEVVKFGRRGHPEVALHLFAGHRLSAACSEIGSRGPIALAQWRALKALEAASASTPAVSGPRKAS